MKKIILLLALFSSACLFAQDITGPWYGLLSYPGGEFHITLNITKTPTGYSSTMNLAEQKAKDVPLTTTTFVSNTLTFTLAKAGIEYKGELLDNIFKGTFTQKNMPLELNFSREPIKTAEKAKRPQEPVKPYPYYEEEVTFKNEKAGITLAGTLTLPKKEGNYPAVILISGSGPQNRDEALLGHKPFLVLSDYLTRNGIAVLRYDDRGIAGSTGTFATAITQDFATDAAAALAYLKTRKEINKNKIGLAGHSEGGIIAPIVATENTGVAFLVLLAGTAIPGDELLMLQNYLISKADGMPEEELNKLGAINRKVYDIVKQEQNTTVMKAKINAEYSNELKPLLISKGIPQDQVGPYLEMQANELASPWYVNFIRYNPFTTLEKVKCPILAINGSNDVQVAAKANLEAIKRATAKSGNKKVTIKELPGLNHLFQQSATGAPADYGTIEETFSPIALKEVLAWIQQQVK